MSSTGKGGEFYSRCFNVASFYAVHIFLVDPLLTLVMRVAIDKDQHLTELGVIFRLELSRTLLIDFSQVIKLF